jgi:hypothetical protein
MKLAALRYRYIFSHLFERTLFRKSLPKLLAGFLLPLLAVVVTALGADKPPGLSRLEISENRRFIITESGEHFFWLGDTAWELFHRLNREEAERYLTKRSEQGFTIIQAVVLAELDGLNTPNAYGHRPLENNDPTRPNADYFQHVDWIVAKANALGLRVGMLPTWGNHWHSKNAIFTPDNAEQYAEWLGNRYRDAGIVWILGGDRVVESDQQREILSAMARGLAAGDGSAHLRTFHPRGGQSSSQPFHDAEWLDFNMLQSGHSPKSTNYLAIEADYARQPVKPCLDGEPAYEYPPDAMPEKRPVGALQVRRNAYWSVFAGAHGHTYGTHPIWQMYAEPRKPLWDVVTPWYESMDLPGAQQLSHLKALMLSRPFLTRIADQALVQRGQDEGIGRVQATRDGTFGGHDATYIMVYIPGHRKVIIDTGCMPASELRGWWFDPTSGKTQALGEFKNQPNLSFETPERQDSSDWILVLDDASRKYASPGSEIYVGL